MKLASSPVLPKPPLAAMPQLSEKPRQGFTTKKTTGKPGPSVCNFTVTLGLRATVVENGVRKTYRARYYNPSTGRFLSRDPNDGHPQLPMTLHKYLYAGGEPVNHVDPRGREAMFEYAIRMNAVIPEAKLISIYGCVADAALAAVDLILDKEISTSTVLGGASTVVGCVMLTPGLGELAEEGNVIVKSAEFAADAAGWGACALDAEDFIDALSGVLSGKPDGDEIGKSIEDLGGVCG